MLGLEKGWAIKRSYAYTLIQEKLIRSVVLRRKGCIKGRRLVFIPSVRAFLASQPSDVDPRLSALNREANLVMQEKQKAKREKQKAEREAAEQEGETNERR